MAQAAFAQQPDTLQVSAEGINTQGFIEPKYAFCTAAETGHTKPGENFNVGLRWMGGPDEAKSYAIVMVDEDVPADFSTANKEGKIVEESAPRRPFYHWVLANIPANITSIPAGAESNSTRAKPAGVSSYGVSAINDYSHNDVVQGGYDGPCPPWNDERVHNYHFRVYALRVDKIDGVEKMDGRQVMDAITPHIMASGEVVGKYTTNPKLVQK